jgi:Tol biopolymer transport system component
MGTGRHSSEASCRATIGSAHVAAIMLASAVIGCGAGGMGAGQQVPHREQWGIYSLDLETQQTRLIHGSSEEINGSALALNAAGDTLAFARRIGGSGDDHYEIATVRTDGSGFTRLTNDAVMDVYPTWSPDGSMIAFLSMRSPTMKIYVVDADGSDERLLYDPGAGDQAGDPSWVGHTVAFTRGFSIWAMADDGTGARRVTHPPNAGKWGSAPLPEGDFDPRLSPDGLKIVFERMVDTTAKNGGYDLFVVDADGSGETRLTSTGWAQGLATYSNSGTEILWVVAAIDGQGKYRLYKMDATGANGRDATPAYFPPDFLCHAAVFARDDMSIYFVGQWWQ